jgi:DNA-binding winged helix-turn-helix (wHTH) protein
MSFSLDRYRFGPYELRTRTREIYKFGLKLKLRPQPFQVLQVLVERSGEVVTRDELRQTLWPAETFVDFEHGLNTSIKELRRVLSDSARRPRYIETLPRLGYRMLAQVEPPAHETTGNEPRGEARSVNRRPVAWWWRAALYFAWAAGPLVGGWVALNRPAEPESSMPVPLTSDPGLERASTWSPDGRNVAFIWNGEQQDGFRVYVMQSGSSQALRLTSESGADELPAWSPDGRWIAYLHIAPDQRRSLKLVSPLGGAPRTVPVSWTMMGGPSWTRDSRSLVVEVVPEANLPGSLWEVTVDTGEPRQLTWPPAGIPGIPILPFRRMARPSPSAARLRGVPRSCT